MCLDRLSLPDLVSRVGVIDEGTVCGPSGGNTVVGGPDPRDVETQHSQRLGYQSAEILVP